MSYIWHIMKFLSVAVPHRAYWYRIILCLVTWLVTLNLVNVDMDHVDPTSKKYNIPSFHNIIPSKIYDTLLVIYLSFQYDIFLLIYVLEQCYNVIFFYSVWKKYFLLGNYHTYAYQVLYSWKLSINNLI